jgi:pimeloyl-ACP methyl ester carboxylesterase
MGHGNESMTEHRNVAELPEGRHVELAGRGTTFVRETPGPPSAPTLLLLHGWTANADLNWRSAFPALADRFHLVAHDHRGHGRGIRNAHRFQLEDCADDAAALIDALDLGPVIPVGYSMGGPIAQLLWQRHPHLVDGLVLCATSRTFNGSPKERALYSLLSGASVTARRLGEDRRAALAMRVMARRHVDPATWTWAADTIAAHDWLAIIDAGKAIGKFDSRPWVSGVDVPTSVVVTTRDRIVPTARQYELAAAIPGATVHHVVGDHAVCLTHPDEFVPRLVEAIDSVVARTPSGLVAA